MKNKNTKLKFKIIFLAIIFCGIFGLAKNSQAATYYIDATNGLDTNSGILVGAPWKTFVNIDNKNTFSPGDNFLFKRGEVWDGAWSLAIESSGSEGSPIVLGAYGSGERPKFRYTGIEYDPFAIGDGHSYIKIEDLEIIRATDSDGYILNLGGDHAIVKNNIIGFEAGFSPSANDGIKILETADYATIENNEIYGAPNQGIDAVAADNLVVKNNTIHDCQNAIVLKGGVRDSLVEKNLVYDFTYGAIGVGGLTDFQWRDDDYEAIGLIVRNNLVYYSGGGEGGEIFLWGAHNCQIYNNTIYGNSIAVQDGGDPNGNPDGTDPIWIHSSDNTIKNNIIWRTGASGIFVVDENNDTGLVMSNNIYHETTGSGEFKVLGVWKTFSQWLSDYDYDDETSRFVDPKFSNVVEYDFHLQNISPAINAGTDVGLTEDFDGNPIVGVPDIGAYEYQGADLIVPGAPSGLSVN